MLGRGSVLETLLTPRAVQAIESVRNRLCRSRTREVGQMDPQTPVDDAGVARADGVLGRDTTRRRQECYKEGARSISMSLTVLDSDDDNVVVDSDDDISDDVVSDVGSGGLRGVSRTETLEAPVNLMDTSPGWDVTSSWV